MFVDFLCTDVSSLLPHLVMFITTKETAEQDTISFVDMNITECGNKLETSVHSLSAAKHES